MTRYTKLYNLPYPVETETPAGDTQIQALAEELDTALSTKTHFRDEVADLTAFNATKATAHNGDVRWDKSQRRFLKWVGTKGVTSGPNAFRAKYITTRVPISAGPAGPAGPRGPGLSAAERKAQDDLNTMIVHRTKICHLGMTNINVKPFSHHKRYTNIAGSGVRILAVDYAVGSCIAHNNVSESATADLVLVWHRINQKAGRFETMFFNTGTDQLSNVTVELYFMRSG